MEFVMPNRVADYEINKLDPYPRLSESMRRVVDYQIENAKDAFDTEVSWQQMRENYISERRFWNEGGPEAYEIREMTVPGPEGDVPVRIYYPDGKPAHHAVVFIHGGGFVVGSNDTHDRMMRCVMAASGCAVIGVDYSLAPERMFPIPLYESAAVVRFFNENGSEYGILPDKMSLCGDSGGANLAMGTNLYLRDTPGGNDFICALMLFYGTYDLMDSATFRLHGSALDGMRKADLEFYFDFYINEEYRDNPYFSILRNDLSFGVPPTYLCCGDLDPLLDDSRALQQILESRGVEVQLDIVPGAIHAYMHYGRMMDEAISCLNNSGSFCKAQVEK